MFLGSITGFGFITSHTELTGSCSWWFQEFMNNSMAFTSAVYSMFQSKVWIFYHVMQMSQYSLEVYTHMSSHTSGVVVRLTERSKHVHLIIVRYWCLIILFELYGVYFSATNRLHRVYNHYLECTASLWVHLWTTHPKASFQCDGFFSFFAIIIMLQNTPTLLLLMWWEIGQYFVKLSFWSNRCKN